MRKLIAAWLLFSAVSVAFGTTWLWPDVLPEQSAEAAAKLAALLSLMGAFGFAFTYVLSRRWSRRMKRLELFIQALPSPNVEQLPEDGPPELQDLSRAMRATAERVRDVVEKASIESSRRETILAGMAEGVLAVDQNLRVIFCNDALTDAFKARKPECEGKPLYEVVREPALQEILDGAVHSGASDKSRFRSSSAGRWFEAHVLPMGEGRHRGAIAVLHDITDIQRQEQLRKDFVADVSHELRTPLASIRGYAETLLDGGLDDAENNRKFVEIILNHAIRLNNIASDLLVLSELDSKEPAVPPERVPVLDVIESAMHTVQNGAALRNVRLIRGQCDNCTVIGYRFRLEQVLVNLLDNGVKFNRADGEVSVQCGHTSDGCVRITVSDTGIGIPSEHLERIFERFYRVDKARTRSAGGTGLGLPIVKEVVERMGGTVTVESRLGKGTRFIVDLQAA
jgi:two-component system, OmpR family, phosphate regulon sensor histidine kinase PhoR